MVDRASIETVAKMTTIIMISQDSSVIISPKSNEADAAAANQSGGGDSAAADGNGTDDSNGSYVAPLRETSVSTEDTDEGKATSSSASSSSDSGSQPPTPDSSFITPRPSRDSAKSEVTNSTAKLSSRSPRRRYKSSLSTLESDSEELNQSSSSAASTLSSRNSLGLLPQGQLRRSPASGTGTNTTTGGDSAFLSSPESVEELRKKGSGGSRAQKPQRRSLPRTLSFSSGSSSSVFVSSTPLPEQKDEEDASLDEATLVSNEVTVKSSPANGPHGIKFFINPRSGKMDLKAPVPPPSLVDIGRTRSLDRSQENDLQPGGSSRQQPHSINVIRVPNYCTTSRCSRSDEYKAKRKKDASFSIYSDVKDLPSLLLRQQKILPATEEEDDEDDGADGWNLDASDVCCDVACSTDDDDESSDLTTSPLVLEAASCSSSSSAGVVLPSGCHRHPAHHVPLLSALRRRRSDEDEEDEDDYLDSLLKDDLDVMQQKRSSSASALFEVVKPPRMLLGEDDDAREEGRNNLRQGKKKKSTDSGKFSYSALSLTNSRILRRRHTTYVKSTSDVPLAAASSAVKDTSSGVDSEATASPPESRPHVHSWHRKKKREEKKLQRQEQQRKRIMIWNSSKVGSQALENCI